MKTYFQKVLSFFIVTGFFCTVSILFSHTAHAETASIFTTKCTPENCPFTFLAPIGFPGFGSGGVLNVAKDGATTYLKGLYTFGIAIASALAVLMITLGGVQYSTTDAIQGKGEGKEKIKSAIIGLLLALLSYTILNTINPYLVVMPENVKEDGLVPPINTDKSIGNTAPEGTPAVVPVGTGGGIGVQGPAGVPGSINTSIPNTRQGPVLYNAHVTDMMRRLSETGRGSDGRLTFTTYGYSDDLTPDTNSNILRIGNRNNPLLPGSVALSRDLITRYNPKPGASVFINGTHVGYYDDSTGPSSSNTIDFYDPNKELGGNAFMRNMPNGQWNISFGPGRQ